MPFGIRRRGLLGFSGAALAGFAQQDPAWSELAGRIPQVMEETKVPGLSIAIVKNGKLAWRKGFGVKDGASKAPVDDGTMFEAASMSKPVFAYAVMANRADRGGRFCEPWRRQHRVSFDR